MARSVKATGAVIEPLVADIMTAMMANTHASTDRVVDNLEHTIRDLRAWREIVCERIESLSNKPYVANPRDYEDALFVSQADIAARAAKMPIYA